MSLTLRDIVARGTPLEWFESVAIVQELSSAIMKKAGSAGPHVPDLPGALVRPEGSIEVTEDGVADESPVFRLAHVLNGLLSAGSPPVQLRLLVLTALSPEPGHRTLPEFSRALEYFERPDRRSVIRIVYDRAQRLPPIETAVAPVPDAPPKAEPPKPTPEQVQAKHRHEELAALAIAAVVLIAAAWWWLSRPSGARVLSQTTQAVNRVVDSAVVAIRDRISGPAPAPVVEATAAPTPAAPPTPKPRRLRPIRPARLLTHGGLAPVVGLAPSVEEVSWIRPPEKYDEVITLNIPEGAEPTEAVSSVYSASDPDVRPPVLMRTTQPADPPPGIPHEQLTRLEVLVSAAGEVESVKIVAGPRDILDGMMLSAVKAWRYQPATRNGKAVAYRHLVWLTSD